MMMKDVVRWKFLPVMLLVLSVSLFWNALPQETSAAPLPLPTRPIPTSTPTPTPTAMPEPVTPQPVTPEPASSATEPSSVIVLLVQSSAAIEWATLWTVVEWQTDEGIWQTVEGWQGTFDTIDAAGGHKLWSVPSSLFGQGPFRWRVDATRHGPTLATSHAFTLPEHAGHSLGIKLNLPGTTSAPVLLPMTGTSAGWRLAGLLLLGVLVFYGQVMNRRKAL